MAGKVVGVFADVSNLYYCIGKKFSGRKLAYDKYLKQAVGTHELYRAFAYGAQLNDEAVNFITCLRHFGYDTKYKKPKQYVAPSVAPNCPKCGEILPAEKREIRKADWDVGIAMDVVRLIDRLDIVVIGSADGDLSPLVEWIKEKGRRCVVLACGISRDLKNVADHWTEIDEPLLEDAT